MTASTAVRTLLEQDRVWDVIVVGSGMGGGLAATELARAGLDVLVVERGGHDGDGWSGEVAGVQVDDHTTHTTLPIGAGVGGSTQLYQAQLERFRPADFTPAGWPARDAPGASVPESWPISYEQLVPYYEAAERLLGVRGGPDPTLPGGTPSWMTPVGRLAPHDEAWAAEFEARGLMPYRSHVAMRFLDGCDGCVGRRCLRECRTGDVGRHVVTPAVQRGVLALATNCTADRVIADDREVVGLEVSIDQDVRYRLVGRVYVLAAGAYATPALLLRSASPTWPAGVANSSGMVGRNLMLHVSEWLAVRPSDDRLIGPSPIKSIATNALYFHDGRKLGALQTVGMALDSAFEDRYNERLSTRSPRAQRWGRRPVHELAVRAARRYAGAKPFATILDDLPYHDNRVVLDPSVESGLRVEYAWSDELRERAGAFVELIRQRLGRGFRVAVLSGLDTLNYAHACGTCRASDDPTAGVVNRDNQAHDLENLYVVDASFFPTSGGINPALTIGANALRVAETVTARLRPPASPTRGPDSADVPGVDPGRAPR